MVGRKKANESELNKWVPCSERLPEETGYYQVTVRMKETGERFVESKHYKTEKKDGIMPLREIL